MTKIVGTRVDQLDDLAAFLDARAGNRVADFLAYHLTRTSRFHLPSLKTWFANHDTVETYQFCGKFEDDRYITTGLWAPGVRELDLSHSTYALLDGSRLDYRGTQVLAVSREAIAVSFPGSYRNLLTVYVDE